MRIVVSESWSHACSLVGLLFAGAVLLIGNVQRVEAQEAICAEVKIIIQQRVSLERQAFEAVLRINNGLDGVSVENLQVNLVFNDADGNPVIGSSDPNNSNATFFVAAPEWSGVIDGSVPPRSSGSGTWLIIPRASAGGDLPAGRRYSVGATVEYRLGEEDKNVEVIPETITVRPQPLLQLDYFLPFDVYGDDPFTQEIEPSQPFTLGVRVKNVGHGEARNLTIETSQPEIVDNTQGLLVAFQILGGYVDDQVAGPSLLLDFGTIAPQAARVGRWQMTASLDGQFRDLSTTYTHADTLGGALTSLIANEGGEIPSHRLVKDVLVDLPGRDGVRDFLAYREGGDFLHVFESEGNDCQYDPGTSCVTQAPGVLSPSSGGVYQLGFTGNVPPAGTYFYTRFDINGPSPFQHQPTLVVHRADGSILPTGNAWISKERDNPPEERDNLTDPWVYYFNLFDANAQETYTVTLGEAGPMPAEIQGEVIVDDGVADPFGLPNVNVRVQGEGDSAVDLLLVTNNEGRFRFGDLVAGIYVLTVADLPEYQNGSHQVGSAGGQVVGASIGEIHLEAGDVATGYIFVKQPVPVDLQADLALSLTVPSGSVAVEEPFELHLILENSGPETAQSVLVELTWPAGLIMEQANGAGAFDPVTREWTLDGLEGGGLGELVLTVRAHEPGSHGISAIARHVGIPLLGDPDPKNNSAIALVEVDPANELQLDVGVAREARVLVFVGCISGSESRRCLAQRQADAEALLANLPVTDYLATSVFTDFLSELRGGYWNVVWLSTSVDRPEVSPALIDELSTLALAGHAFVIEGNLAGMPDQLSELLGGPEFTGDTVENWPLLVVEGELGPVEGQVTGNIFNIRSSDSTVLAGFPMRTYAAIERTMGAGRVQVLGFNLSEITDPASRTLLASALFDRLTPEPSNEVPAGGYVTPGAWISNGDSAGGYRLLMQAPPEHLFVEARPAATTLLPLSVEWTGDFQSGTTLDRTAILAVPATPSSSTIDITLSQVPPDKERVDSIQLTIIDHHGYLSRARAAIAAIQLSEPSDLRAQQRALWSIDAAIDLVAGEDYEAAYAQVINAIEFVHMLTAEETVDPLSDLGHAARQLMHLLVESMPSIEKSSLPCQGQGRESGETVEVDAESANPNRQESAEKQDEHCEATP